MRNRALLLTFSSLAIVSWLGLIVFLNRRPPTVANQTLFLLLLGVAVAVSIVPIAYAFGRRISPAPDTGEGLSRAARQGLLAGILAMVLMAMRLLRALDLFAGVLVTLLAVVVEVLLGLRRK